MAASRVASAVIRRRCLLTLPAWRSYTTSSRPTAAAQVEGSSSDLMDDLSEFAKRLPPAETSPYTAATRRPSAAVDAFEPVPPHPEWVMEPRREYVEPPVHKKRFGIHVATLSFTVYNPDKDQLPLATGFALQAAWHLGIPCSRPASYPIKRELHTVLKSGFVHKKAQENFWRLTHKRVIKAFDANEEVINRWINYLSEECIAANVSIKAERFTYRPLKWGEALKEEAERERQLMKRERAEREKQRGGAGFKATGTQTSRQEKGGSTEEQVRALAEELIEKELAPRAEEAEKTLQETGTEKGKTLGTLEEVAAPPTASETKDKA